MPKSKPTKSKPVAIGAPDKVLAEGQALRDTKLNRLITALKAEGGADIPAMMLATGWQAHSVRGALAGTLKKRKGLIIESEKREGVRVYHIVEEAQGE